MRITRHDREVFSKLLQSSEDLLIEIILCYAQRQEYTRYMSTQKEAWRLSIGGFGSAMIKTMQGSDLVPEFGPDDEFTADPGAIFGLQEARRYRAKGINLVILLGLMKYYRQAYLDLLQESAGFDHPEAIVRFIGRFFDRIELAYYTEWAGTDPEAQIDDLNQVCRQLVHAEKMAAIGQLSEGIAHEINTPIQYINDNALFLQEAFEDLLECSEAHERLVTAVENGHQINELLSEVRAKVEEADLDYLFQEIPKAIHQSQEGVAQISSTISAMKAFARPGTKQKIDTDINDAIMSAVNISANQWKTYADMEVELDHELPRIPCVPGDLNQAVLNIIVNAIAAIGEVVDREKATDKGRITIRTYQDGEWIAIDISDTGPGIPEGIQLKIFEPFFSTRDVGIGTGHGLAITYSVIVEKHAGKIDLQSRPDEGSTFTIRLPILTEDSGKKVT